jgi:hypothetical protein
MFAIVSYQSAFIVVNSALYFASKLIKAIKCVQMAENLPQAPAQASGDTKTAKPKHFIALMSLLAK